jgi:hypothetical protein
MRPRCPSQPLPEHEIELERHPLVWRHRTDPRFASERQVAVDVDQTIFPLIPSIAGVPGGRLIAAGPFLTYECLTRRCGGLDGLLQILERATAFEHAARGGLFHGVRESLEHLRAHGFQIHFMTHRPEAHRQRTQRFLDHFELSYDSLTVSLDIDKPRACRERGISTLIDDKPQTILDADAAGVRPLSLSWTYNRDAIRRCLVPFAANWSDLTRQTLDATAALIETRLSESVRVAGGSNRDEAA